MREDHIESAVTFLREPQVASAALAKKVEFLESKGLTTEEINEALKRAQTGAAQPTASSTTSSEPRLIEYAPSRPSYMLQQPPPLPQRDWKDYFVMGTVSVGVAYGLYACAKRYILPMIMPPTPAALEADKEALDAEFQRMEDLIKQLQTDTAELRKLEETRTAEFSKVMNEAHTVISAIRSQSEERKQESKLALSNVEVLRDMIPRALQKHSETQAQAVNDLQKELKSLKQLMSRNKSPGVSVPLASTVPSSLPGFPRKKKESSAAPETTASDGKTSGSKTSDTNNEETAPAEGVHNEEIKPESESEPFIPDPQSGIPEWQRAAAK